MPSLSRAPSSLGVDKRGATFYGTRMLAFSPTVAPRAPRVLAAPALFIAIAGVVTLCAVWAVQGAGYAPCELCLKERIPFYWGVPLALLVAGIGWRDRVSLLPAGYAALGIVFLAGAGLGIYHAGVEWHLWAGPSSCTGNFAAPAGVDDFLHQLQTTQVVRCDAPALKVGGLSLAAWNAALCLLIVAVALYGFMTSDRSRVRLD